MARGSADSWGRRDPVRRGAVISALAGAVSLLAGAMSGNLRAGLALAAGLLLGGANPLLARRLLGSEIGFAISSLGRLALLTVLGVGIGFLLGVGAVWLVILGLAAAQMVLVAVAARESMR